jgi:Domain of unknown function (DUF4340)
MKIRGLLVAVIVLAALTGTLYWSNHHKPSETAAVASDVSPKILALQEADINGIAIKKKDADQIVLKKDGNDWRITAPQSFAADQSVVSGVVSALANLDSQRLVEDHASDLNPYGLSDPSLAVSVTEKNNKSQQVLLGDATPTGNGVYARLQGDPRVFTLASFNKTSLDKGLNDLRDKRLITADADKISRIELTSKQETIEFGRGKDKDDKSQWQILKPKPMRADGSQVDSLVRAVTDARMDLSSGNDAKKNASAFASGAPVASVKLSTDAGSQELQLRKIEGKDKNKNDDDYYAKTSVADGVYKVPSSLGQQLDKKLEDFRNKKLFDFGFAEPNKIELHDGAKPYFFTHSGSGDDWWSAEGQKLDADSVEQLVVKLRDLQASKFVDTETAVNPGVGQPVVEITITSNDGKRVEQIRISKAAHGQDYFAQRQNEATLYQLDQSAVADLQNLAASVKSAATSKK